MSRRPKQRGPTVVYVIWDANCSSWNVSYGAFDGQSYRQVFQSKTIAMLAACTAAFHAGVADFRVIEGQRMDVICTSLETYIYFIAADEHDVVKIGVANDIGERLSTLQTGSPVPLRVLAHLAGVPHSLERWLHSQLTPHWSHGEWFKQTSQLKQIIRELRQWTDGCGIKTPELGWKPYPKWAHPKRIEKAAALRQLELL